MLDGLGFRQADGGHLGVGEDHRRHGAQVQGGFAPGHVDGSPAAPGGGDIDELRLIGAVTGGIEPRHRGVQMLIDQNRPTCGFHAEARQVQGLGIGCPSGGHQQLIRPQGAGVGVDNEFIVGVVHAARLGLLEDLDALAAKRRLHRIPYRRVFLGEQAAAGQHRDPAAQPGEGLGQFQGHHRGADHNQPLGKGVQGQRTGRGQVGGVGKTRDRRYCRSGASTD